MTSQQQTPDNKKINFTAESIFPFLVVGLSLVSLTNHTTNPFAMANLLSLIGIAGMVLYFKKNDQFKKLIYIWIIAQLVVIDREILDSTTGNWYSKPFWDLTQVFSVKLGLKFQTDTNKFGLNLNIIALFHFGLLKILEVSNLIGKQLTFKQIRAESALAEFSPLTGTVIQRVTLSKEKDWLLILLTSKINFDDEIIEYVLVKSKNGEVITPKLKRQIVYVRQVIDLNDITEGDNDIDKFPFIDWALCE